MNDIIENKIREGREKYEDLCEEIKRNKRIEIGKIEQECKSKLSSITFDYKQSLDNQTKRYNEYIK